MVQRFQVETDEDASRDELLVVLVLVFLVVRAAVKNRSDLVKTICCMTVDETMTEEQMRPEFERVLQGRDLYGNTVMHYFALRKNDVAIAELLRVGGCMCIRNYAGQSAIDVRKTEELHMLASNLPVAVVVFKPSATPTMRIENTVYRVQYSYRRYRTFGAVRGV